jgi:glutamate dehydrogenase
MTNESSAARQKLLDRLENLVREKFPDDRSETAARFVRLYYARVRADVLETRDLLDLYGAALAHLGLARQRRARQALVRVYNPALEQDGWECPHTVVEIVVEDMPFLVDSVRMAVNRRDLKLLRIIHPIVAVRRDGQGRLVEILERNSKVEEAVREAVMHLEILRQTDRGVLEDLKAELVRVVGDVQQEYR